jgi:hypothetical protein
MTYSLLYILLLFVLLMALCLAKSFVLPQLLTPSFPTIFSIAFLLSLAAENEFPYFPFLKLHFITGNHKIFFKVQTCTILKYPSPSSFFRRLSSITKPYLMYSFKILAAYLKSKKWDNNQISF